MIKSAEERLSKLFWSRVDIGKPDECWNWSGTRFHNGFGRLYFEYKDLTVHRVAYQLKYGALTRDTLVEQTCENRLCCNPKHLKASNRHELQTNMAEHGVTKGYAQRGEKNRSAKLTEAQVLEIKRLYVPKVFGYKKIAKLFGVSETAVGDVIRGTWWKWLAHESIDNRETRV